MQRGWRIVLSKVRGLRVLSSGAAAGCALSLAACSVSSPLAITSTGDGVEQGSRLSLIIPQDAAPLETRFAAAVERALSSQSIGLADKSTLIAEITAAQSEASSGFLGGDWAQAVDEDNQDWIARPRRDRPLDRCKAQRLRATLTVYDSATGTLAYRGSGEAIECSFEEQALVEFAEELVADALRTGQP